MTVTYVFSPNTRIRSSEVNTNFQNLDTSVTDLQGGWVNAGVTWTYASASTFTISGDYSAVLYPGMRLKLTQTTVKYFIITKVAYSTGTTTVTVYGGTDYTVANAAITSPYYSSAKCPAGFPMDRTKWTVLTTSTSTSSQAPASNATWYNLGTITIAIPIGVWDVQYQVAAHFDDNTGTPLAMMQATLSTANNSSSDSDFNSTLYLFINSSIGGSSFGGSMSKRKTLVLTSDTTYYLNEQVKNTGAASITQLVLDGDSQTIVISAICAYL